MAMVHELARWVTSTRFEQLSEAAVEALEQRVLDGLGCALGALEGEPIAMLRTYLDDVGGRATCTLIGGGRTSPDRAALYNGALVRYLDFNDSYLAPGETCHPSDNLAPVLAAAELADTPGRGLLTALAVAYQVQCRLSDVAPVRAKGFDHTTQGSYAVAAGAARALGLDAERTANALAIAGTAFNALRVTRTGHLSHWKGLAYPNTSFAGVHAVLLARRGITGPPEVFEGNKGFMDSIAGEFSIDWSKEDLERVRRTILKKYNAEIHSQSTLETVLDLRRRHGFTGADVTSVEVAVFDVAYNIIGGGEEGSKRDVATKEEADHSLPYLVAVALLDGEVLPAQYLPERIRADDVQQLLRRVEIRPDEALSGRFPEEMPVRVVVRLRDGRKLVGEASDYPGFVTQPMSWDGIETKLRDLARDRATGDLLDELVGAVRRLPDGTARGLAGILARVGKES